MKESRKGLWTCIILICALVAIMLLSVSSYSAVLRTKDNSDNKRATVSYLRSMVKNADIKNGIELRDDGNMLVLKEFDGDEVYELRIYAQDGYLLEEYTMEGMNLNPSSAQQIAKAGSFKAEFVSDSLLKLSTDNESIVVHLFAATNGDSI